MTTPTSPLYSPPFNDQGDLFISSPQLEKVESGLLELRDKIRDLESVKQQLQARLNEDGVLRIATNVSSANDSESIAQLKRELQQAREALDKQGELSVTFRVEAEQSRAALDGAVKDSATLSKKLEDAYVENRALTASLTKESNARVAFN